MFEKLVVNSENSETTIRTGQALPLIAKTPYHFVGDIESPYRYAASRLTKEDQQKNAIVEARFSERKLILYPEENYSEQISITGELIRNKELDFLGINDPKACTLEELKKRLRQAKPFFITQTEYNRIYTEISSFNFQREMGGKEENDKRGNYKKTLEVKTATSITHFEFQLKTQPFESHAATRTITVEIFYELSGNGTPFFTLENYHFELEINSMVNQLLLREAENFKEMNILVLWK